MTLGGLFLRPVFRRVVVQALARAFDGRIIAEVGVYRGRSARWVARAAPHSPLHLFDTFAGMPPTLALDSHKEGDFARTSMQLVRRRVPRAWIHRGLFPYSVPDGGILPAFVHLDGDLYATTKAALALWPDATFLVDDYGATTCRGCRQAVSESGRTVIALPTEQALVLRGE